MPSIGETLREARMRQRLDIADVETRTKIRAKYLRALENEEFGMLPGPTFVKTFLRTYAEMLGLDPHVLVEEYRANYERDDDLDLQPLGPTTVAGRDRRHGPRFGPGSLALLALVAILGVLLAIGLASDDDGGDDQAERAGDHGGAHRPSAGGEAGAAQAGRAPSRPGDAHLHLRGPRRRHAGAVQGHDRGAADVPRQEAAREPRQARRSARR